MGESLSRVFLMSLTFFYREKHQDLQEKIRWVRYRDTVKSAGKYYNYCHYGAFLSLPSFNQIKMVNDVGIMTFGSSREFSLIAHKDEKKKCSH